MVFGGVGMAFAIQIVPRCRHAETKCVYNRPLLVDNDNYERWIDCLAEFATRSSEMSIQITGWWKTCHELGVRSNMNAKYIVNSSI